MICKHCGKENEDGARFCMWCGNIFEEQYVRNTMQLQQDPMPGRQPIGTNGDPN